MLQFLQSTWLWAAAGIIVPVIIHLYNIREGKTLKVGSIALLSESAKSHAKRFKLFDLLLLALRCFLLIVLAMLLAQPRWEKQMKTEEKGWILIERNQVKDVYNKFKPTIDKLIKNGYDFHCFETSFAKAKLEDVLKNPAGTSKKSALSYWALVKELDQKVPAKLPVYLFTDNSLKRFTGTRPEISSNLKWSIYSSADTISRWIEKAYKTTNDSICVIIGNSNHFSTYYTYQNISPNNSNSNFALKVVEKNAFVSLTDTSHSIINKPVQVDTSAINITIFTDKFAGDADYVKAAINAVKDFTKYKIKVSVVNNIQNIPYNYTWLFWLSEETLPASKIKNNVFLYEKGKVENTKSVLVTQNETALTANETIGLFKLVSDSTISADKLKTIWQNGFGEPVLSSDKQSTSVYHFYNRFNPQWNDLVWSNSFPQVIYNLLFQKEKNIAEINGTDKRIMDSSQIQPLIVAQGNSVLKQNLIDKKDLSKVFWLIAFILFLLERIISFRRSKSQAYG